MDSPEEAEQLNETYGGFAIEMEWEVGLLHGIASTGQTQSAVRRFCRRYDLIDDLHSLFCAFFEKKHPTSSVFIVFLRRGISIGFLYLDTIKILNFS